MLYFFSLWTISVPNSAVGSYFYELEQVTCDLNINMFHKHIICYYSTVHLSCALRMYLRIQSSVSAGSTQLHARTKSLYIWYRLIFQRNSFMNRRIQWLKHIPFGSLDIVWYEWCQILNWRCVPSEDKTWVTMHWSARCLLLEKFQNWDTKWGETVKIVCPSIHHKYIRLCSSREKYI
jgi:hypothetical protein